MTRLRISQRLLCIASILAFKVIAIARIGPGWEVPQEVIVLGMTHLFFSTIIFLVSIVYFAISIRSFRINTLPFKIVHFTWIAIVLFIYALGWSHEIFVWYIDTILNQILLNIFTPGIVVSLTLLITLELGNKRATSEKHVNMIRVSQILLFGASILAFEFLDVARWGSEWENIQKGNLVLLVSTVMFLFSVVFWAFSINIFREISLPFKIVYSAWVASIVAIYIFGWSQELYRLSVEDTVCQILIYTSILGLIFSFALLIIMEWGNRRAEKQF